jgi:antirestriction protein ArdC
MKTNSNIAQEITDSIITQLENGVAPWVKPWSNVDTSAPHNPASGTYYRGANFFWLTMLSSAGVYGSSNIWMTYAQAQKMGAQVTSRAKGKGVQVIFYKPLTIQGALNPETMQHDSKVIPMLKTYTVFNADFIDGLPVDDIEPVPVNEFQSLEECERFIASTGATIKHGGNNAFYAPDSDFIQLPEKTAFNTNADYYSTVLHELSHWTGHKSRLDRDFSKSKRFGDNAYAFEELVAELGSAMLCAHLRIDGKLQHANYLGSWLKVLKADSKAILKASAEAQKILDKLTKHEELGVDSTEELKAA